MLDIGGGNSIYLLPAFHRYCISAGVGEMVGAIILIRWDTTKLSVVFSGRPTTFRSDTGREKRIASPGRQPGRYSEFQYLEVKA